MSQRKLRNEYKNSLRTDMYTYWVAGNNLEQHSITDDSGTWVRISNTNMRDLHERTIRRLNGFRSQRGIHSSLPPELGWPEWAIDAVEGGRFTETLSVGRVEIVPNADQTDHDWILRNRPARGKQSLHQSRIDAELAPPSPVKWL